jgi:hypothetical protein
MIMLILVPVYMRWILPAATELSASGREAVAIGFSHAYYGAIRHSITVGFISLMILGMAAKVVPTLKGVDSRQLRPLWLPFVLANLGCLLRVSLQIWTDFSEKAYPLVGMTGFLEVGGIAIWGVHLWRIMSDRLPGQAVTTERPSQITAEDKIGLIIEWFPQTLPVLLEHGFSQLANPVLRRTIARTVSVRTAAKHHNLDVNSVVATLNAVAGLTADSPVVKNER